MPDPRQGSTSESTSRRVDLGPLTDDTIMGQTERVKLGGMIDTVTQSKQLEGSGGALCEAESIRYRQRNTAAAGIGTHVPESRASKVVQKGVARISTPKEARQFGLLIQAMRSTPPTYNHLNPTHFNKTMH